MGPRHTWFRCTTWNEADRAEFERRLSRARPSGRPQYLRIQALTLIRTRIADLVRVGLSLTDRFLRDYPDDWQAALVYEMRGDAYEMLGEIPAALQSYRDAASVERT